MVIVTHEMEFAREVADRVFYLDERNVYEQGTPDEIFDAPQGEKTRAFVGRLKTLSLTVDSAGFDLLGAFSQIDLFCIKYSVDRKRVYSLQLMFEELSVYLLAHFYAKNEVPAIDVTIDYGERSKLLGAEFVYAGRDFDPQAHAKTLDIEDALGIRMIGKMASETEHVYENGVNRFTVRL